MIWHLTVWLQSWYPPHPLLLGPNSLPNSQPPHPPDEFRLCIDCPGPHVWSSYRPAVGPCTTQGRSGRQTHLTATLHDSCGMKVVEVRLMMQQGGSLEV